MNSLEGAPRLHKNIDMAQVEWVPHNGYFTQKGSPRLKYMCYYMVESYENFTIPQICVPGFGMKL